MAARASTRPRRVMRFKVKRSRGQFYLVIIAPNGEVVAHGERCHNRADVLSTIRSIKRGASDAPIDVEA